MDIAKSKGHAEVVDALLTNQVHLFESIALHM